MVESTRILEKVRNVYLHKLYLPPEIIRIMEERKEGDLLYLVECMRHETYHTGLSKILIHNEQSTALLGAYVYIPSYRRDDIHIVVTDQ